MHVFLDQFSDSSVWIHFAFSFDYQMRNHVLEMVLKLLIMKFVLVLFEEVALQMNNIAAVNANY